MGHELLSQDVPALPGGWRPGDTTFYTGPDRILQGDEELRCGHRGKVTGLADAQCEHCVEVAFEGHEGRTVLQQRWLSNRRPKGWRARAADKQKGLPCPANSASSSTAASSRMSKSTAKNGLIAFAAGDRVHVWSRSQQVLFVDGVIEEVQDLDDDEFPAGSVEVSYGTGISKWLRPDEFHEFVQKGGPPPRVRHNPTTEIICDPPVSDIKSSRDQALPREDTTRDCAPVSTTFLMGDHVHVWSRSEQVWFEDGFIQTVQEADDGDFPALSVEVVYGDGITKWLRPEESHELVQQATQSSRTIHRELLGRHAACGTPCLYSECWIRASGIAPARQHDTQQRDEQRRHRHAQRKSRAHHAGLNPGRQPPKHGARCAQTRRK